MTPPDEARVIAGVWDASEYRKLPAYDGDTWQQRALGLFFCHQQDGCLCAGWVGCHDMAESLAVRLHPVDPSVFTYESPVRLFASGAKQLSGKSNAAKHASAQFLPRTFPMQNDRESVADVQTMQQDREHLANSANDLRKAVAIAEGMLRAFEKLAVSTKYDSYDRGLFAAGRDDATEVIQLLVSLARTERTS